MSYRVSHEPKLFFRLRGDQQAAKAFIRQGRIYFAQLIDAMSERDWPYMFRDWRLPTGETFLVHAWRDHRGEWGTVEITAGTPVVEEPLFLPDPESGFLNIEDLSTTTPDDLREFPALYQSARTRALYGLAQKPVPPQNEPPSHWYDETAVTPSEAAILRSRLDSKIASDGLTTQATGKYRLYQQAKRGLALVGPGSTIEPIYNSASKTRGLWRAPDFTYWLVDIEAQSATPSVTFQEMRMPESVTADKWLAALKHTVSNLLDDPELILETWIASNLEPVGAQYVVQITSNDANWEYPGYSTWVEQPVREIDAEYYYPMPGPISQGWKFNWDGNKAACVIIEARALATHYNNYFLHAGELRSHVIELEFTKGVAEDGSTQFFAVATSLETNDWQYSHRWGYWIMLAGETKTTNWDIPGYALWGTVAAGPPNATPVYCFYTGSAYKNNFLSVVRITVEAENINEVYGPCGRVYPIWGFANGGLQAASASSTIGALGGESVSIGAFVKEVEYSPTVTTYTVAGLPSGTWIPQA